MKKITTLVHHIKLNESGWWEKAVQNIIISTIGFAGNFPQTRIEILDNVYSELEQGVDKTRLEKQLEKLISLKHIVSPSANLWLLSEEIYKSFDSARKDQAEIESKAKNRFVIVVNKYCNTIDPEELWITFTTKMLFPLVKDIGAKTYEFISGKKSINFEEHVSFQGFLKSCNGEKEIIEKIVNEYLSVLNNDSKAYLLKLLNEYFFIEATNLDENTVEEIYKHSKTQQNLKVFVDTNFLLTILDLHDNPSNEATHSLLELLDEISNKVKVKFYILPNTIHEFQNLIYKFQDYISKLKPTMAYAAAVEETSEFSGIVKKYFQRCNKVKRIIPPDEYFDPFITNFSVLYRSKGIELHNQNVDKYSTDQRVVDDLTEQTDYRYNWRIERNGDGKKLSEKEKEDLRNRIYDKFNHDCQIWHIVKDKRPTFIDSPKDVINWIITLDYSFLEYDKFKQKIDANQKVGICIHPNELISMLQFWVPRTAKFEKAILGNFKMPFLFKDIDSESEKISIEILSSLSQFEDHQSYSKELITEILTNRALRQKIKPSNSVEQNAELIKAEILKKFEETQQALIKEKETTENLEFKLHGVSSQLELMNSKLEQISKNRLKETEDFLKRKQQESIDTIERKKQQISEKINLISDRISDMDELKIKADKEVADNVASFKGRLNTFIGRKNQHKKKLESEIFPKYINSGKYSELANQKETLINEFDSLELPKNDGNIIVFCENKNANVLNNSGLNNVSFIPEQNSNSVFIKVRANPDKFGLRDRDFLTDEEIQRLKKQFKNYFILEYYCFENYLFHPENLAELNLMDFNNDAYKVEIIRQKNEKRDKIISIYKKSRDSYQELKIDSEKIKCKKDDKIIEYLKSDDIEIFFKSFSMKDYFDKKQLANYNLTEEILSSTNWFKVNFLKVIEMK